MSETYDIYIDKTQDNKPYQILNYRDDRVCKVLNGCGSEYFIMLDVERSRFPVHESNIDAIVTLFETDKYKVVKGLYKYSVIAIGDIDELKAMGKTIEEMAHIKTKEYVSDYIVFSCNTQIDENNIECKIVFFSDEPEFNIAQKGRC
jgi:hypothetical protein